MERRLAWGAGMLLVRPAYVALELVVAAGTTGDYSLLHDTVSDLGALDCAATYCSPWHDLMNGTFVGTGLLLAGGAALLAPRFGRVVTGLLVVAGFSSVATGLAPIDQGATAHALAAAPLFVCQPVALLLLARRVRGSHPRLTVALGLTGAGTAAAAVGFILAGGESGGAGLLERLALWPVLFALAGAAVALRGRTSTG